MNEFIIQWYSRSIFNFQPFEIKQLFRKIETKSKQLITNNLHQEFNNLYIYIYIKVTKCVRVNFFVGALINMVCELKYTSGSKKKLCKNFIVIRHCVKELLAKKSVTQP